MGFLGIIFLLVFPVFWFIYIRRTSRAGAPYVPMETDVVNRVMEIAQVKEGDTFYELGSGDGRLVIAAALRGATACGIEIDPLRVLYSRAWLWILRLNKAKIIQKNFFDVNLSDADVVHTYLLPQTNERLQKKFEQELKPGTKIVSVAFTFPGWEPVKVDPRGTIYGPVYLYKI